MHSETEGGVEGSLTTEDNSGLGVEMTETGSI